MRSLFWLAVAAFVMFAGNGAVRADDYPARPVTLMVPFSAGGATDTHARFLAEKMRAILGQPIVIENVAGAAGSIGVSRAVRSAADGYTLSIGTSTTHMLTGGLYKLAEHDDGAGLGRSAVKQRFAELGIQLTPISEQSPQALRAFQKQEAERWWPIMKAADIKGECGLSVTANECSQ